MSPHAKTRAFAWFCIAAGTAALIVGAVYFVIRINTITTAIKTNQDAIRATQSTGIGMLEKVEDAQRQARRAAKAALANQAQIKDCITPGGKCFDQAQRETASAVGSINQITYYAVSCADEPGTQTLDEIQQCVIEQLAAHPQGR